MIIKDSIGGNQETMTRKELESKGWKFSDEKNGEFPGKHHVFYKGDPLHSNCIWLTLSLDGPKIEIKYTNELLVEGWIVNCSAEDLHQILHWIISKKQ